MRVKHPINNLPYQDMLHTVTDTPHLSMGINTIGVVYNYNKKKQDVLVVLRQHMHG